LAHPSSSAKKKQLPLTTLLNDPPLVLARTCVLAKVYAWACLQLCVCVCVYCPAGVCVGT
jgi:hypothetical protein